MDSESLVLNAYHESQQEAISEVLKRNSMSEKMTNFKNNVYEKQYLRTKSHLDKQKNRRLKQLTDNSNVLRHEAKLMELDRQRHIIEVKKRMQPSKDFSYYTSLILNKEKRLGLRTAPCYLDKEQRYPMRLRSVSNTCLTPTVRKARASLLRHDVQKSNEKDTPTGASGAPRVKSTPISTGAYRIDSQQHESIYASVLISPTTERPHPQNKYTGTAITHPDPLTENNDQLQPGCDMLPDKFPHYEHSQEVPSSAKKNTNGTSYCDTVYQNTSRPINNTDDLSDEDDKGLPDHINLFDHFFGNSKKDKDNPVVQHPSQHPINHPTLLQFRRVKCIPPRISSDTKKAEVEHLNAKVQKFVKELSVMQHKEDAEELCEIQTLPSADSQLPHMHERSNSPKSRSSEENKQVNYSFHIKSSTMPDILRQAVNNDSSFLEENNEAANSGMTNRRLRKDGNSSNSPKGTYTSEYQAGPADQVTTNDSGILEGNNEKENTAADSRLPRKIRYSWRNIQARSANGHERGIYTAEDLVLQALTGIPIRNVLQTPVPLHAASRAMRHTATFKMHAIVEKLVKDRTRYQRHVVEELKRQITEDAKGQTTEEDEIIATKAITSTDVSPL